MSVSATTIWQVPAYLPYVQPALTERLIEEAERRIGHQIPDSYLELLRRQNGGYIRYSLPNCVHTMIYGIGPNLPSLTEFDWSDCADHVSYDLDGLVPFDGDGHWHLCLDYRCGRSTPSVAYVDVECDNQRAIAPSFADYLDTLRINVGERDFFMPGISDLERTLHSLQDRLGITFEPPESYDHGYPIYRAPGGTKSNPEWIWISPNQVPRGFVREDDSMYEQLRHLMSGDALRYPELPESSYLLSMTEGLQAKVLRACKQGSIDVRPLSEYVI